jgi:hypothetical protein
MTFLIMSLWVFYLKTELNHEIIPFNIHIAFYIKWMQ